MQRTYARAPETPTAFAASPPEPPPTRKLDLVYVASQCVEPGPVPRITIASIRERVEEFYGIEPGAFKTPARKKKIAHARQVAMYLSKQLTPKSLPDIGRRFGDRDHTTILHGIRAVKKRMETDGKLANEVNFLRGVLEG